MTDSMGKFDEISDEELQEELDRRSAPPDQLASEDINISSLSKQASEFLDSLQKNGCSPKDAEHYMFEGVMTTFYGPDIWDWINKRM